MVIVIVIVYDCWLISYMIIVIASIICDYWHYVLLLNFNMSYSFI